MSIFKVVFLLFVNFIISFIKRLFPNPPETKTKMKKQEKFLLWSECRVRCLESGLEKSYLISTFSISVGSAKRSTKKSTFYELTFIFFCGPCLHFSKSIVASITSILCPDVSSKSNFTSLKIFPVLKYTLCFI